jgi:hypothetical protein
MRQYCDTHPESYPTLAFNAVARNDRRSVVPLLMGTILGLGGWILQNSATDDGTVTLMFEFECHASLEIYSALISAGLELSKSGHIEMTRLWMCSRHGHCSRRMPVASIAVEIFGTTARERVQAGSPL